jgi:hypothetical protein
VTSNASPLFVALSSSARKLSARARVLNVARLRTPATSHRGGVGPALRALVHQDREYAYVEGRQLAHAASSKVDSQRSRSLRRTRMSPFGSLMQRGALPVCRQ